MAERPWARAGGMVILPPAFLLTRHDGMLMQGCSESGRAG